MQAMRVWLPAARTAAEHGALSQMMNFIGDLLALWRDGRLIFRLIRETRIGFLQTIMVAEIS